MKLMPVRRVTKGDTEKNKQHNETYKERAQREREQRRRSRAVRRMAFYVSACVAVLVLCVINISMRVETTRLTNTISEQQAKIVDLDSQYTTLLADQGSSMTLAEVEDYAKNQLGMVSYDRSQEEYLAVERPDQVVVEKGSSGVDKLVSSLVKSFNAVLSFLR